MSASVDATAHVHPNVHLGAGVVIGRWVEIGTPPVGAASGELPTEIGEEVQIRTHCVIYAGAKLGPGVRCGHHVMIREHSMCGAGVSIGTHTVVEHHVEIESGVRIHTGVFIPEYSVLREGCWIGPRVVFTNARYPQSPGVKERLKGAEVGGSAMIGANATILPGVTIGEGALVGAGSVVVENVAAGTVVAGNPARKIRMVAEIDAYRDRDG